MAYEKIAGAFKTMGNTISDGFGKLKVGAFKYGPDILEGATALGAAIPGPWQAPSAAAHLGIKAVRNSLAGVPNEAAKEKLDSVLTDSSKNEYAPSPGAVIGKSADGSLIRQGISAPKIGNGFAKIANTYASTLKARQTHALPAAVNHLNQTIKTREAEAKAFRKGKSFKKHRKIGK